MTAPGLTLNTVHGDAPRELLAISTGPPLAERATYGRTHRSLAKSPIPDTRVALSPWCARPATPASTMPSGPCRPARSQGRS